MLQGEVGLEACGLDKAYGDVAALRSVHLTVRRGDLVGLLGANGAGKTTLLRILAGILPPDRGSLRVLGSSAAWSEADEMKRHIGLFSSDTGLYKRMTCREVVRFFGGLYRMEGAALDEATQGVIGRFEIGPFANRLIGDLSSGQRQRVAIARAVVHDPEILLLDEATASLDIISNRFLLEYLREAAGQGKCIVFSTHVVGEIEYLCTRVVLLHQGRIIADGSVESLLSMSGERNLAAAFIALTRRQEAA